MRIIIKHHIATKIEKKHGVKVSEVLEVFEGKIYTKKVGKDRYCIIGRTLAGRFLTIFVDKKGKLLEVVTARDSTDSEKRLYRIKMEGK
jgi:uncharacterized DUF497 family protein